MKKRGYMHLETVIMLIILAIVLYFGVTFLFRGTATARETPGSIQEQIKPGLEGFKTFFGQLGTGSGGGSTTSTGTAGTKKTPDVTEDTKELGLIRSANLDYGAGKYEDAIKTLLAVINDKTSTKYDYRAYNLLGDIYKRQGNLVEAFKAYAAAFGGTDLVSEQEPIYRKMLGILVRLPNKREELLKSIGDSKLIGALAHDLENYKPVEQYKQTGLKIGTLLVRISDKKKYGTITAINKDSDEITIQLVEPEIVPGSYATTGGVQRIDVKVVKYGSFSWENFDRPPLVPGENAGSKLIMRVDYDEKLGFIYGLDDGTRITQEQLARSMSGP